MLGHAGDLPCLPGDLTADAAPQGLHAHAQQQREVLAGLLLPEQDQFGHFTDGLVHRVLSVGLHLCLLWATTRLAVVTVCMWTTALARLATQQSLRRTLLSPTVLHVAYRQTPRMRLASLLIGRPVLDLIDEMRASEATWPQIRQEIADLTHGEISVTWQAVQSWARKESDRSDAA